MSTPHRARLWHVPHLARILWRFGRSAPWLPRVRSRRTDLAVMARITRRGWVQLIRDGRGPAAFIARDGALIHALYVNPRARRRGLGRSLLHDAKLGSARLELFVAEANRPARAFYAAEGFCEVARSNGARNDEKLPEIHMIWHSAPNPGSDPRSTVQ
ncbi:GNAT family N-acetyltransferase [Roseovarius sp. LXJ103]|uniref:GNAT family N-acetyltransferase n=1 Tax=Roseovarius carneus TaxID=2853164 RepID=UPI000D61EF45|nr:GNAT family N-acetyltransferase [Roseovarius carneus]MBZ8117476.1 GNAT family N-acetyltransferase [Roseovarius carneus]PWE36724.1 GNAT family N-acetyltransferase [Pelagicola sp. LXJ1103]